MTDNSARAMEAIRRRAALRLLRAAVHLQQAHKRNLAKANPFPHADPAPTGSYPRGRSWNLRDAVQLESTDPAAIVAAGRVRVGVLKRAYYGRILAERGWLGLADTARAESANIDLLLQGKSGGGG